MQNKDATIKKTALDYSQYITNNNIKEKLEPVNKTVDDLLVRLEEFETMFSLIQPDIKDSKDILNSIISYKPEFDDLCDKIDSTEFMIAHIKTNLDTLEGKIEEAEAKMGISDAASKVSSILTPLFKKSVDRRPVNTSVEQFKVEDYIKPL
ncbi:biogenesis of lysosome-related organelles complex 1 subunit 4 [Anthonomus grandis grandis]|uniref:biogenesis of lysosome-related organelles complex 1 subunit 4 n=1 Tax=Anthonomus grandis grandis TaxID=2921223 RepID=UPI002165C343|nr:biogenesis of lysosome-related organelles complex 1 subunit 4 [Anthonomus grandis grandis]